MRITICNYRSDRTPESDQNPIGVLLSPIRRSPTGVRPQYKYVEGQPESNWSPTMDYSPSKSDQTSPTVIFSVYRTLADSDRILLESDGTLAELRRPNSYRRSQTQRESDGIQSESDGIHSESDGIRRNPFGI